MSIKAPIETQKDASFVGHGCLSFYECADCVISLGPTTASLVASYNTDYKILSMRMTKTN
jgi:hypothetical protein